MDELDMLSDMAEMLRRLGLHEILAALEAGDDDKVDVLLAAEAKWTLN
jgi:hypothetical protein